MAGPQTTIVSCVLALAMWRSAALPVVAAADDASLVTVSIVGTSDLHGSALPRNGLGGLPLLSGYVKNLRTARATDGGAVLLLDSGDTFQGDVESDLSEGAGIVDAYNAMAYTAKAIGNHDFDFGSVDSPTGRQTAGDLRGAIKARAAQSLRPFLAANLIDDATGRPVAWPNVQPSVVIEAAGVKVGIVGVITIDALSSTLAANVQGLHVAPLVPAIVEQASMLRASGADVVVVAAHAGGRCAKLDDPSDLSTCEPESEIFKIARSLPHGLVDVIAAGHTHAGIAHFVNGIGIVEPFSRGQAFDRADIVFNRKTKTVSQVHLFAPRSVCERQDPSSENCASPTGTGVPAQYEGRAVVSDPAVVRAMQPALDRVHRLQATMLGVSLEASILRGGERGSPLGNLFADAMRSAVPDADVAVVNSATRGLWADVPAGPLTFGRVYNTFPFDNRVARITLTAAELSRWLAGEFQQGRRSALGVSGVAVRARCATDGLHVELLRAGHRIDDDARLLVVAIGGPTLSGNVASADPLGGGPPENGPVVRELVEDWLRQHPHLADDYADDAVHQRIEGVDPGTHACVF